MEVGSSSESFDVSAISDSLRLKLAVRSSSCARQMTSVFVRIYPDRIETSLAQISMQIPRSCFKLEGNANFFMKLDANSINSCPETVNWKPLQQCRQYKIIFEVEYSSKWKSSPFVWEKFIQLTSPSGDLIFTNISLANVNKSFYNILKLSYY